MPKSKQRSVTDDQRNFCEYVRDLSTELAGKARSNQLAFLAEMLTIVRHEADKVARGQQPSPSFAGLGLDAGPYAEDSIPL
jgi:hypothetical protein